MLCEKYIKHCSVQTYYLKFRNSFLRQRYGEIRESNSMVYSLNEDMYAGFQRKLNDIQQRTTAKNFAFDGVHHIFDQHTAAISMIKFANNDRSKICCASFDGHISICEVTSTPPRVVCIILGHKKGVTAIDWSISNDLIVSSSLDSTLRLWQLHSDLKLECLRVVGDPMSAEVLSCAFVPANNNLVITGNAQGYLQIVNISTGKYTRDGTCQMGGKILSIACEESGGTLVWAGNDRGVVFSFRFIPRSHRLSRLRRIEGLGGQVTSISWRTWLSKEFPWPTLLISSACNAVTLYRVVDDKGSLVRWKKYPVKHRQYLVHSTFCPQMGASLIATGSEDGSVHLLDSTKEGKAARVNRLLGHATPVVALCFNYDESLLATAEYQGLIIIWRNNSC
ncbi:WD repeat-containing protein 13-like isoform X2 [Belonocnema kinseyi]|nr:WD repeat-containing protein 13-like isoform X2 [Belonocnema kinseyi]